MPRNIPIALKEHLQGRETTVCFLMRVDPVIAGFPSYFVTNLNRNVVYDDGGGSDTYLAAVGLESSALVGKANLEYGVDESVHLLPVFDIPVSESDIRAGVYDYAEYTVYLVNYEDLSQGHLVPPKGHGNIGKVSIRDDGLSWVNELAGLTGRLLQSLCEKDSLGCRAIFGSQPIGSATPGPQVDHGWCGFDATSLLVNATVVDVGIETTLSFQVDDATGWTVDKYAPGIVKFLTGLNAGRSFEIESNTADGWITLQFEAGFPIADGDTLQYREDCSKQARDEVKGCKKWFDIEWVLHFRGEPDIPVADEGALQTPGAMVGPGGGGNTNVPFEAA